MSFSYRSSRLMASLSALALMFVLAACDSDDGGNDSSDADTDDAEQAADSGVADDPATALEDAVSAIADWDGVELTFSFDADETARASLTDENPEDAEVIDVMLDSSIRMVATGDEQSGAVQFAVTVQGTDVFELFLATAGETFEDLAVRVDLPAIKDMVDDPQFESELDAMVAQAGMFGLQDAADALSNGDWVAIAGLEEMTSMVEDMGGETGEEPQDGELDEDTADALAQRSERFVAEDVEVTHEGTDDVGERLRVVADGPALESYLQDVSDLLASSEMAQGMSPDELDSELQDLPDEVTLDVWISGGELRQVAIDLAAMDDTQELDGEFVLVVGLANHAGGLSAPSAAVEVDVMSLFGQMMGGAMGGFDDSAFDDLGAEDGTTDEGGDDLGIDDGALGDELSQEDIDMMLQFMDCVSDEDLDGFRMIMPEVAEAAEQAIEDGTLERC